MTESTTPPTKQDSWTVDTYAAHNEALRAAEEKFQNERDRRYAEVDIEKEKALKIKETADLAALGLAREIQTYKDEKANQLREQINTERVFYVSKDELAAAVSKLEVTIKPTSEYVTSQQGRSQGGDRARSYAIALAGLAISFAVFWSANHRTVNPVVVTPTVTAPTK